MKALVDLAALVEALGFQPEDGATFFDRESGQIYQLSAEELALGDNEEVPSDLPDWQRPVVDLARQVLSDSSGRFVELPDRWEIHEYRALEGFASNQDPGVAAELLAAIRNRGAFRRFKDVVHRLGLEASWYNYRHSYLLETAREWCEANGVPYEPQGRDS